MTPKGISIIICCYNSESRLPKTLEYLSKQTIDRNIPVELLIVNNASTDNTKEVALEEWNKYGGDFLLRMIDEDQPGHMYARRRGVQESQYEYVLFCDDDNWLQSDYLQIAFDLMESNARIGALGGKSIAVSDIDFPEWFSDFETDYAVGEQSNESGDVTKRRWLWGAGIVARRVLLNKVFDKKNPFLNQGRTGNVLTSGDDIEICKRILLLGYTLYYDKSLVLNHYIAPNRLTWAYKKKLVKGFERSNAILQKYDVIYNELNNNIFQKMKGVIYLIIKKVMSNYSKENTNILYAKIGLMLKNEKISKDLEYKSILKFVLDNNHN